VTIRKRFPRFSDASFRVGILALALLLLTALLPAPGSAGSAPPPDNPNKPYALIFGTVWGPDDRPVYGVKVKVRPAGKKGAKWEIYSNHQGEFAVRVPAAKADYIVWADAKDLKHLKSSSGQPLEPGPEVTVHVTFDERQDIGLHLK
jgi:hypothetical protein